MVPPRIRAGAPGRPPLWTLLVILLALAGGACATRSGVPRPFPGAAVPPGIDAPQPAGPRETPGTPPVPGVSVPVVATALEYRGVPYRNGGTDPSGFDCSGFVQYVFARHGTSLPREVRDQYRTGRRVDVNDIAAGDLVFFQTVSRGASHVGLAIGNGQFVHAPSSRGVVRVERYDSPYWGKRFVGARRVTPGGATPRGDTPARHRASPALPGAVRSTS